MTILRSILVTIVILLIVAGATLGFTNWILNYTYEIIEGDGVRTYVDAELTQGLTGGDLIKPSRSCSVWREMYVHNESDTPLTITPIHNRSNTFEVTLWLVDGDVMVEQFEPLAFGQNEVKHCWLEFWVYPDAPLGTGNLEVILDTEATQ